MEVAGNRLAKVRTFRDDVDSLLPNPKKPEAPVPTVAPIPPKTLPPVMVPVTPLANTSIPTPLVTPFPSPIVETPPSHNMPEANVVNQSLIKTGPPTDLSAGVRKVSSRPSAVDYERLSVMETDDGITEGTIITDQKRNRFSLGPAVRTAVGNWFQETKETIVDKTVRQQPVGPTVRALDDRKQVVEKASKQSALAPKDDHEKMTGRLPVGLNTKAVAAIPAFTIKEKALVPKPGWQHFEGKAAPAIPAKTAPVAADIQKPITTPTVSPVIPPPPVRTLPQVAVPKIEPVELTIAPKTTTVPNVPPPVNRKGFPRIKRLALTVVAIVIAAGAAGGGVMLTLWLFGNYNSSNQVVDGTLPVLNTEHDALVRSDKTERPILPRDRAELYTLVAESGIGQGTVVVLPTMNGGGGVREANTAEILETLNWKASAPLLRSIEQINLGMHDLSPFVVIRTTSFDTAFGGILAAESNLSEDLAPLFGEPVTATFDANQAANEEIVEPFFADDIVQNHDVRVLRDELQKERLVYGFINKNTIIIAPDRDTFRLMVNNIE